MQVVGSDFYCGAGEVYFKSFSNDECIRFGFSRIQMEFGFFLSLLVCVVG